MCGNTLLVASGSLINTRDRPIRSTARGRLANCYLCELCKRDSPKKKSISCSQLIKLHNNVCYNDQFCDGSNSSSSSNSSNSGNSGGPSGNGRGHVGSGRLLRPGLQLTRPLEHLASLPDPLVGNWTNRRAHFAIILTRCKMPDGTRSLPLLPSPHLNP